MRLCIFPWDDLLAVFLCLRTIFKHHNFPWLIPVDIMLGSDRAFPWPTLKKKRMGSCGQWKETLQGRDKTRDQSSSLKAALSNRTFYGKGNVLYLRCPLGEPVATSAYWILGTWLVQLRNWLFTFIKSFDGITLEIKKGEKGEEKRGPIESLRSDLILFGEGKAPLTEEAVKHLGSSLLWSYILTLGLISSTTVL